MRMIALALSTFTALVALQARAATIVSEMKYKGMCEASTAESLGGDYFAVASDESNVLKIYRVGNAELLEPDESDEPNTLNFTALDKSDIEASAKIGATIYWLSSHSFNSDGEDKKKRKIFFATEVASDTDGKTLKKSGELFGKLRDFFPAALKDSPSVINIEGLATAPDSGLYLGFRSPLTAEKKAIVLPLKSAGFGEAGGSAEFGDPIPLELGGRGIRSIEAVDLPGIRYLVVGGPVVDEDGQAFALFKWSGVAGEEPEQLTEIDFKGLKPEAMFQIPDTNTVAVLSDDDDVGANGAACQDDDPGQTGKTFRLTTIAF